MHFDLIGIFAAGLLTFASPCILPLAPIYLGLLSGASVGEMKAGRRMARTVAAATAFALGLSLVFVLLGMAATAAGHALVAHRALFLQLGGLAVFLFGLKYLGVLNLPWLDGEFRPGMEKARGGSLLGALVMGAAFGLGWTPCIGPVLGSVLTFTATSGARPQEGALYLAVYAAGLSLPMVAAATVAPLALGFLQRAQRWMRPLQLATGGLLAVIGLLLLTDNLGVLTPAEKTVDAPREQQLANAPSSVAPRHGGEPATVCESSADAGSCGLPTEAVAGAPSPALMSGPVMVEFVGRTCPVCLRMTAVVRAAERDCAGESVRVQRVEVDGPGGRELARRFAVVGVPTFLFLDGGGGEVARLVGEQPLAMLEQSLQVLSGQKCAGFRAFPAEFKPGPPS